MTPKGKNDKTTEITVATPNVDEAKAEKKVTKTSKKAVETPKEESETAMPATKATKKVADAPNAEAENPDSVSEATPKAKDKPAKKKNIHEGHRARMRDRFLNGGLDNFAPHEVLELLLFEFIPVRNTNPLAHELINHFGSVKAVLTATKEELMTVPGVGERTAEGIISIYPFMSFRICEWFKERDDVLSVYDIAFLADWFLDWTPRGTMGIIVCGTDRHFLKFVRHTVDRDDLLFDLGKKIINNARDKNYYLIIKDDYDILAREKARYLHMITSRGHAFPLNMFVLDGYKPVSIYRGGEL